MTGNKVEQVAQFWHVLQYSIDAIVMATSPTRVQTVYMINYFGLDFDRIKKNIFLYINNYIMLLVIVQIKENAWNSLYCSSLSLANLRGQPHASGLLALHCACAFLLVLLVLVGR